MKKKKIISAVSAVALAVSSLVPLSANSYEIIVEERQNNKIRYWVKQDENDHMGFTPSIFVFSDTGYFNNNIVFTTIDGSILTKADFPEYGGEGSEYFDISYEDGVHTMSFRSNTPFLKSAELQVAKRARSLSFRKNISNVRLTSGKFIQYCVDQYMHWDNGLIYTIAVSKDSDYIPAIADFDGMDIDRIETANSTSKENIYTIYTNATEEELSKDYLLSNAYIDNYFKLKEIQNQSGKFDLDVYPIFLTGGGDIGTVPADDAGDFNLDDKIDVKDFFTLSQFIAEVDKETINADQADVNRDGVADVSDLLAIAQYIVKQ